MLWVALVAHTTYPIIVLRIQLIIMHLSAEPSPQSARMTLGISCIAWL